MHADRGSVGGAAAAHVRAPALRGVAVGAAEPRLRAAASAGARRVRHAARCADVACDPVQRAAEGAHGNLRKEAIDIRWGDTQSVFSFYVIFNF